MLDVRLLRDHFEMVKERLRNRNEDISGLDSFLEYDKRKRQLIQQTENLKNQRNVVSQEVVEKKKSGENAENLILAMRQVGEQIKELDRELRELDEKIHHLLLAFPNLPHESVPVGVTEEENVLVRHWGKIPLTPFELRPHWELAQNLDLLDFERASKVVGSRFVFYKGLGAQMERALVNFMLDLHTEQHGYTEMIPPYMVNRQAMIGTGQLPKFEADAFAVKETDWFLIPTSEVPITNYHQGEILNNHDLPKYYVASSACFRSEAGSAGRDTRGLIRQHQFNKVELVKLVRPEDSYDELDKLVNHAEKVLQLLELPYRVIDMCTGDLGFAAAKKYDIEVWLPSSDTYREISSCSNFEDFQARRAQIRFRRDPKAKPEFVHTLNGSGLAIGRTMAAILENYQQKEGHILIPKVLQPYMRGRTEIHKK